tara:strand:+ start:43022 stop:43609 length:588 start_codon:yes stop_codon:yes gene_type:complete
MRSNPENFSLGTALLITIVFLFMQGCATTSISTTRHVDDGETIESVYYAYYFLDDLKDHYAEFDDHAALMYKTRRVIYKSEEQLFLGSLNSQNRLINQAKAEHLDYVLVVRQVEEESGYTSTPDAFDNTSSIRITNDYRFRTFLYKVDSQELIWEATLSYKKISDSERKPFVRELSRNIISQLNKDGLLSIPTQQ